MSVPHPFRLPTQATPTERCYWVADNRFLAGAYPGHSDNLKHFHRIETLFAAGPRTFINLMEENEVNNTGQPFRRYDDHLRELASKKNSPIAHLRFPIQDGGTTTIDRMRSILDSIDLSLAADLPIFLHCFGGMGRTGTVVCCWLLRHQLATPKTVLETLTQLRQADKLRADWKAPENDRQVQFVLNWND